MWWCAELLPLLFSFRPSPHSFCAACINAHLDAGAASCPACVAAGVVPPPRLAPAPYDTGRLSTDATLTDLAARVLPAAHGDTPLADLREARYAAAAAAASTARAAPTTALGGGGVARRPQPPAPGEGVLLLLIPDPEAPPPRRVAHLARPYVRAPKNLPLAALARFLGDRTRVTASLFKLGWVGGDAVAAAAVAADPRATVEEVAVAAWGEGGCTPGGGFENVEAPLTMLYRT